MSTGGVQRLQRVSRTVADLDRAVAFHCHALDFRVVDETARVGTAWAQLMGVPGASARVATLRLGAQELELLAFSPQGRAYPTQSDAADLCFQHIAIVVSDMQAAYARLCRHAFTPISQNGPQQLPPGSGSVAAYKFRDPDGHPLELLQFPPGSGDPSWQDKTQVFLGVDHSAIDVADIDASVDFYTRVLGFSVASRTLNSGPAQQRLDGLRDDVVDVVALQPAGAGPPHVELLGYRQPRRRRPISAARSNDVVADRLVLQVDDLPTLVHAVRAENAEFVSPGIVTLHGDRRAALLRDPNGHCLLLCS